MEKIRKKRNINEQQSSSSSSENYSSDEIDDKILKNSEKKTYCQTPNCDGTGNINKSLKTHRLQKILSSQQKKFSTVE